MNPRRRAALGDALLAASVLLMVLQGGCDDGYDGPRYVITGEVWHNPALAMTDGADFMVRESIGGEGVPGATVTVNGTPCVWSALDLEYRTEQVSVPPGDDIVVEVELGAFHAAAFLTMPDGPIVTAPTGSHDASAPIAVEWSTSFVPDRLALSIDGFYTVSSAVWSVEVDGALASCVIPAGTLKPGMDDIFLFTGAVNATTSMGPCAGNGSRISAVYYGGNPMFSTQ